MRRLDQDLNRFTIELEADTAGITEILEQSEKVFFIVFYSLSTNSLGKGDVSNFLLVVDHILNWRTWQFVVICSTGKRNHGSE